MLCFMLHKALKKAVQGQRCREDEVTEAELNISVRHFGFLVTSPSYTRPMLNFVLMPFKLGNKNPPLSVAV
jgi:hypothetical protein